MANVTRCLKGIESVRCVASGTEVAYVARSRVARLILDLSRMAADLAGVPQPQSVSMLKLPEGTDPRLVALERARARLLDVSRTITQPSEPLDDRWRAGWDELLLQLSELERQLRRFETPEENHGGTEPRPS